MKKIILILTLLPIFLLSQSNNTYKEFNFGIAVVDDFGFPGASFLFGQTNYNSNMRVSNFSFRMLMELWERKLRKSRVVRLSILSVISK